MPRRVCHFPLWGIVIQCSNQKGWFKCGSVSICFALVLLQRTSALGSRGRRFESGYPDWHENSEKVSNIKAFRCFYFLSKSVRNRPKRPEKWFSSGSVNVDFKGFLILPHRGVVQFWFSFYSNFALNHKVCIQGFRVLFFLVNVRIDRQKYLF